jgi:hypothetical protein
VKALPAERRVAVAARLAGLFLLRRGAAWEFLSCGTGKRVLTWVQTSGAMLTAAGRPAGRAHSPFGAMHKAIHLDRAVGREQERGIL